ncbi:MAG TPA: Z1 domain-containing protein [Phycisphaerae bacterium]|nr:Z1 domain-containing protein [Phycisphaerae bacterium]
MATNSENLETAVEAFLSKEPNPSPARIRELIEQFRVIDSCSVDNAEAEYLARRFEERHGVTMTIGAVLTEREYEPWLDAAQAEIDPYYWNRYRKLLGDKHFSGQVIAKSDEVTDRILGLMESPDRDGPWDRRGMVVGHVQSGKTANYTGLICKAADAGYKLIVVIAGIHNNLRNQTQLRIDEGFVGRDSARLLSKTSERFVGVGRYDQTRRPVTFTNSVKDFNKQMATGLGIQLQALNEPAVFVIKKNPTTLKNLIDWLREHSAGHNGETVDIPMLLIDDEADNASINIRYGKDEVSRINGRIRELLKLFGRSCYVGYTATPFANIFIDPDTYDAMVGQDLFPRHFVVSLDPPSNYFGPESVFLNSDQAVVRHIDDNEDLLPLRHKIDHVVAALPPSLIDALRAFVLTRAIRLLRGHRTAHCSMLVNASRFTNVQKQLRNEIHSRLTRLQDAVRVHGALPLNQAMRNPEIASLHDIWHREFSDAGHVWAEVLQSLHDSAAPIKVVEINSKSSGTLNYADHSSNGLSVVAVGGFSLSRGLTLEGLNISYFLRNSMMYDTLMQMGRWFGYRPDYADLCRVWMPEEAEGWYSHVAESIEMLRDELRQMEAAGATPEQFGLKVRSHPDTLIVTARNKIGSGEKVVVSIGLGNHFVETAILKREESVLARNLNAARRLASSMENSKTKLSKADKVKTGWLVRGVPVALIKDFLSGFDNHPGALITDPGPIRRYIEDREADELRLWDVLFASLGSETPESVTDNSLGIPIICQSRTAGTKSDATTLRITNKQRVASRGVEKTGLDEAETLRVETQYREEHEKQGMKSVNYPDRIYRAIRPRPLLIVHLLKVEVGEKNVATLVPVLAWSISFPPTKTEEKRVQYVVNTTWLQENYGDDKDDDMENEDEE